MEIDLHEEKARRLIKDRWWRLNNLYWIKPKEGRSTDLIKFKPNWAQTELFHNSWYRSLILKARQLGVTTYWSIFFLDDCVFNGNREAGIIADTRENAEEIFRTKVKSVWDNIANDMPDLQRIIKSSVTLESDQGKRLIWSNGSAFRVGTSMRSGTLTQLLVTEYGKICAKEPEKAREIRTGSIETLPKDAMLVIESTAMGNQGDFFTKCQSAREYKLGGKALTELDYRFFFFPWHKEKPYSLDIHTDFNDEDNKYFDKLLVDHQIELTNGQKSWYNKKKKELAEDIKREYPSTPDEAFEQSIEGAYFAREVMQAYSEQRITDVPILETLPVYTSWDLGINDTTCICFFQLHRTDIRIFDFYENKDEGLIHYIKFVKNKGYLIRKNFGPWDIDVRDYSLGKSRKEFARDLGFYFDTVPKVADIMDKIESARLLFSRVWVDERRCSGLVSALKAFRKEWDEKRGCYKNRPLHDWASNPFDSFVTGIQAIQHGLLSEHKKQQYAISDYDYLKGAPKSQPRQGLNFTGSIYDG